MTTLIYVLRFVYPPTTTIYSLDSSFEFRTGNSHSRLRHHQISLTLYVGLEILLLKNYDLSLSLSLEFGDTVLLFLDPGDIFQTRNSLDG